MVNKLHHLKEFREVLKHYRVSDEGRKVLEHTKLALLVAPTSSGRNTIVRDLLKTGEYHYIISDTTRKPRINDGVLEKNGVEYWFRSEEEVLADLKNGKFLEAAIIHEQQVSGISMREIKKARQEGKVGVTDIEIAGVRSIIEAKPDTIVFFVIPPNFDEWQRRLKSRGAMSVAETKRRLISALKELESALEHPYYTFVVNDKIENALEQIHNKAAESLTDRLQQKRGREITEKLYIQTQEHLRQL